MTDPTDDDALSDVPQLDELAEELEQVQRIADDRYLIDVEADRTGDGPASPDGEQPPEPDSRDPSIEGARARYAVEITAKTDAGVASTRVSTDDVRDAFGDVLRWYLAQLAPETPPEAALDLLLQHLDWAEVRA